MISAPIEATIRSAGAPFLTNIFLIVLLAVFSVALYCKAKGKAPTLTQYAPTLLTSLGILGTFTGIVAGLLEFDTASIDSSIGPLLEGLKTAFITSLSGMLLSIFYKVLGSTPWFTYVDHGVNAEGVTANDLYRVMEEQSQSVKLLADAICGENKQGINSLHEVLLSQADGIEQLKKAIGGDDESSLVGQFKLMRSDMNDNHRQAGKHLSEISEALVDIRSQTSSQQEHFKIFEERLWIKLQDFADMLSKSATEQVIEALKTVIMDFNNQLTEQFGENFKQLNLAVGELVTWQENYKQQLSEMKAQYDQGVQAITQTESSVAHIGEKAQSIPVAMDDLVKVIEVNQHQINELSQHLNAFEQVRDKAVEAVPEIRNQIDMAIAGAQQANEEMAKGVQDSTEQLKLVVVESADNYRDTIDRTRGALDDAATTTANSSIEIKEQFADALEDINSNMRNLIAELQQGATELNEGYKEAGSVLVTELQKSGQSMNEGITTAASDLVTNLQESGKAINDSYQEAGQILMSQTLDNSNALKDSGMQLISDVRDTRTEFSQSMKVANNEVLSDIGHLVETFMKTTEEIKTSLRDTIEQQAIEHRQRADSIFAGLEGSIEKSLSNTGESVQKQVEMIDMALEQEVTKVMQSMADALVSISGQFTKDYSKLTREMSKIVRQTVA